VLLAGYEWLAIGLAAVGAIRGLRRHDPVSAFLLWHAVGNLAIYSWAGEKFAWLVLHPLLPIVLLAGMGAQVLWDGRARILARAGLGLVAVALVPTGWAAIGVAFDRPADGRELLVSVQTSSDVLDARDAIERLVDAGPVTIEVDSFGGTSWPWAWYLRDESAAYPDMSDPAFRPTADVVLVDDLNHALMAPHLEGWEGHRYRFRVWWLPEYGDATPAAWFRWLVWREPWSPTATFDQWIYVRDDLADAN
jgi:predicted membrane-bound mannosyltransferase